MSSQPIGLYIHIPWCVRKCPYCDFNSHVAGESLPWTKYLAALCRDLQRELARLDDRPLLSSIFIGGGTPSLAPPGFYEELLGSIDKSCALLAGAEVTLEANPGAGDHANFAGYKNAGINRLSLGVQSFDDAALQRIGRIHSADAARLAFAAARRAGFDNINIDLMHGLPGQTKPQATDDLAAAIALQPEHLSWYQLTIEPNTRFYSERPALPDELCLSGIEEAGFAMLDAAGFNRYEVSAFARSGRRAQHNLNYWTFGDYLGIGAGAHGKQTRQGQIVRRWKTRMPADYMRIIGDGRADSNFLAKERVLEREEIALEFMLNALRLAQGVSLELFESRSGLVYADIGSTVEALCSKELVEIYRGEDGGDWIRTTAAGYRYLNDVVAAFDHL